jgi:hypothetical protein
MSDPVDLTQRRAALVDARMLECGAILTDAIELMWHAGANPSEIVQNQTSQLTGQSMRDRLQWRLGSPFFSISPN